MKKLNFKDSSEFKEKADQLFIEQKGIIQNIFPDIQVEHVGGTSVPGALTLGDLDIQVRVSKEDFKKASKSLENLYYVNHPEIWNDELAIFHKKDNPVLPMSIMLTVIDSPYDEYYKIRDLLRNDPMILKKYNEFKMEYEEKNKEDYTPAKRSFFGLNGQNNFLK